MTDNNADDKATALAKKRGIDGMEKEVVEHVADEKVPFCRC